MSAFPGSGPGRMYKLQSVAQTGPCYDASSFPRLVADSKDLRRKVPARLVAQEDSKASKSACLRRPLFQGSNTLSSKHLELLSLDQPVLSSTAKSAEAQPEVWLHHCTPIWGESHGLPGLEAVASRFVLSLGGKGNCWNTLENTSTCRMPDFVRVWKVVENLMGSPKNKLAWSF